MRTNTVKHRLREGGSAFGTLVNEFATPGIARIMAAAGVDYALFDMEHTGFGFDLIRQLISYSRGAELIPLVRVPASQQHFVSRCLDVGALGVMLPMVETADQVRDFVRWSKFAPVGERGQAWGGAHDDFLPGNNAQKMRQANEETMLLGLIESARGVENLEAILEVGGLDVAWVGHNDLSSSLGVPGQYDHPRYREAVERVLALCQRFGCTPAATSASLEGTVELLGRGFRCVAYGTDVQLLQTTLSHGMARLRETAGE
jgi:2-keto-3-deoxy-L-rhamnonate aldolase RhmA